MNYWRDFRTVKMTFIPLVMSCTWLLVLHGPWLIQTISLLCYLFILLISFFWPFFIWLAPFLHFCSHTICIILKISELPAIEIIYFFSHLNISILFILFLNFLKILWIRIQNVDILSVRLRLLIIGLTQSAK